MGTIVVRLVRFTNDVARMQAFLEAVGLRPRIEARGGGWVDLISDSGMVALHDAATSAIGAKPGQTWLSFEANDVDQLADQLRDAGVPDVTVHDEAYRRALSCTDPLGDQIWVDGRTDDLYGYRTHPESRPEAGLSIVEGRGSAHLTFATHEHLDAVAARLVDAGHGDAHAIVEDFGSMLSVTDPDGQEVQVHEAPSS